ncbi:MAG: pyridoxal phosphate-dependent aminotransferase [Truepera sp.]|nr:pyridoxal phosphate-dependent aminotransferase [Truepera sp.]
MPQLSRAINNLKASSTVAFNAKARELAQQGVDVVAMTAGEPDFQPPAHVLAAAHEAIDKGLTKYTATEGMLPLREAVAAKFKRENGLSYTPEQIIVSSGGKQVLYNAFMAILNPGDEVVLPAPYWVSYPAQIQLAGGVTVPVPTEAASGFIPDPEAIRRAITWRTRAMVINSPCNPTGAVYPAEVIKALAELAVEHDLWLITDDLYEHLIYEGSFTTAAQFYPERTLIVHGASKAYALTGWRIGYGAGPKPLIAAMNRLQGQVTSNASAVAQYATIAALTEVEKTQAFIAMTKQAYQERRDVLVAGLNRLGLKTPLPHGAFYVMTDTTPLHQDENEAALLLLSRAHVGVVPGTDFGAPGQVRLSYATNLESIHKALERIAQLLD